MDGNKPLQKTALVGFDASIDITARPVRRLQDEKEIYFQSIGEFGEYIQSKAGLSCAIQYREQACKFGGNAPFFTEALSKQGVLVTLVGMLGADGLAEEFAAIASEHARLLSFAEPMSTTCLEFSDGKIMLSPVYPALQKASRQVLRALGKESALLQTADLLAFLNWGELDFMHGLWQDLIDSAHFSACVQREKFAFFDPADLSKHDPVRVEQMLRWIQKAGQYRQTILSVNENEAMQIGLKLLDGQTDVLAVAQKLQQAFAIDVVVVHTPFFALACAQGTVANENTEHVKAPVISTGAGDHFNAGFCTGMLHRAPLCRCLQLANRSAKYYLENGASQRLVL